MTPQTNKVSKCCGDRLCAINDPEGTGHYECFACKKPCDSTHDCTSDCYNTRDCPVPDFEEWLELSQMEGEVVIS